MACLKRHRRWIGAVAIALLAGCAPAYHRYSGCCVDCRYCAPAPLPYVQFAECGCHSCAASRFLRERPLNEAGQPLHDEHE